MGAGFGAPGCHRAARTARGVGSRPAAVMAARFGDSGGAHLDWKSEATWRKANPNYGVSVLPSDIAALARKAIQSARSQNNFLTKRLDVWVSAACAFYNMDAWLGKCCRDCHAGP